MVRVLFFGAAKMPKQSAGLMMYRVRDDQLEVFLVHPGGPYWVKKDLGAWSLPKGEYDNSEPALQAAIREFHEETGFTPNGNFTHLGSIKQTGGKVVTAWAFAGDCDPAALVSNTCEIEWPPRSGRRIEIPEVDRGRWFSLVEARRYIRDSHGPFLDRLAAAISSLEKGGTDR